MDEFNTPGNSDSRATYWFEAAPGGEEEVGGEEAGGGEAGDEGPVVERPVMERPATGEERPRIPLPEWISWKPW